MDIVKTEQRGVIILAPDGRLDSNSAPSLEQEIGTIGFGSDGHHLLLDLSKVEYISSAGLRVVLKTVKERQSASKSFAVSNMQDHVREVFEISGFDSYVTIFPDTAAALASFE
ncbi:MAG: STAS domain-containing protein [Desulfofustis sp.]|jgi:anti-sigma B factor antagonist|nr:STAS domain-containing protein [Desulfofustis sp.]